MSAILLLPFTRLSETLRPFKIFIQLRGIIDFECWYVKCRGAQIRAKRVDDPERVSRPAGPPGASGAGRGTDLGN